MVDDPGNHPPDIIVFMRSNASNPFHRMEHGRICCSGKRERDGRITFRNSVEVFPPPFVADGRLAANNALQPEQTLDEHSTIDQSLLLTGVTGNDELMVEYLIEARTGSVESTMARAGFDLTYLEIGGRFDANVNIPRQISAAQLSPRTFETNLLTFIPHVPTEKITAVNGASAPDELKKTLDSLRFGDKVVLTVEDTKKGKRREVAVYAQ